MLTELPKIWIVTNPDHQTGPIAPLRHALGDRRVERVGVQLRAKRASDRTLIAWGRELRAMTRATGSLLFINQRPDVAHILEADGVHLPETGLPIADVQNQWPHLRIGASCHNRAGLLAAQEAQATYAFLSPVFEVPGKNKPLGLEGFRQAIEGLRIPVFALGGIGPDDTRSLLDVGARGVAVRRSVYEADEPGIILDDFVSRLDKDHTSAE